MNDTILKFAYPQNLLKEYEYWVVLLRPKQITAGSVVLACKEDAENLESVSTEAYKEFNIVAKELEATLKSAFQMDKINYLALMMVDKQVHFHVVPRYSPTRKLKNIIFEDTAWPKPPDVLKAHDLKDDEFETLKVYLLEHWK